MLKCCIDCFDRMSVVENITHASFFNNRPRSLSASSSCLHLQIHHWLRAGFVDEQPTVSRTPPCPTRNQPSKVCPAHRQTAPCVSTSGNILVEKALYPFLVNLVNSVECVLDSYSPQVSGRNLRAQGEMQIDPSDRGFSQMKLKNGRIFDRGGRTVDFPDLM